MALYKIRAIWFMNSGAFADRAVWQWGVESATEPDGPTLATALAARLVAGIAGGSAWKAMVASYATCKEVEVFPAAGGAMLSQGELNVVGSGGTMPSQVTLPVSSLVASAGGPTPRGRFSFGPLGTAMGSSRPNQPQLLSAQIACVNWRNDLDALGHDQVVINAAGTVGWPVVGFVSPNAFGTMRTRGWEQTTRTVTMI